MLINEHFFIDCLNLGNWKISVTAWINYLSIWNSVDRAEQKSSQKIDVPCLDSVKQTQRTLSNPVKYLHYIVQNDKGFEIGSPRCRCRGELGRAWAESRVRPFGAHPTAAGHCPGCWHAWHTLMAHPTAHPKGSPRSPTPLPRGISRGTASPLSLCHMQNSHILARRSQANLATGQLSRVFKINQNPGGWEKWGSQPTTCPNCISGQLRDAHRHGHHN